MIIYRVLLTLSFVGLASHTFAEQAYVAVAANFAAPMKEISKAFESSSEHRLLVSFASSGKLYAQIKNGAPYQVFLSADQDKVERLVQDKLAIKNSQFTYALGSLALWHPNKTFSAQGADILKTEQFNKLAIANPRLAPYGIAAVQALKFLGLETRLKQKLVQGENISQTYQFIHSGNADLGFVAFSQIQTAQVGTYWLVPSELHHPIRQDAVLLNKGQNNPAALSLLNFLQSEKGLKIIESFGYLSTGRIIKVE